MRRLDRDRVATFLRAVGEGDRAHVQRELTAEPRLVNATGPHPYWGGEPQPLHVALDTNRPEMLRLLLARGADVNGASAAYGGWSPLLVAIVKKRRGAVSLLLRRGARPGLAEALVLGDDALAARLLRRGRAAVRQVPPSGGSWMRFARTPWAVDRLIELGVSGDAADDWGETPALTFARNGRRGARLVRQLARHGVRIPPAVWARLGVRSSLRRALRQTPTLLDGPAILHAAVEGGHLSLVEWWLSSGADVQSVLQVGSHATPLHTAAWRGDLKLVQCLLRHGADPRARDGEHRATPREWAETAARITSNPACLTVAALLSGGGGH